MSRFRNPPLKRHPSMQPLSRDHYSGLVIAQTLSRGSDGDDQQRRTALNKLIEAWSSEIAEHFHDEERLLPALMTSEELDRLRQEHRAIRQLVAEGETSQKHNEAPAADWLRRAGQTLNDHIRWEERELFVAIEKRATPEQLRKLEQETTIIESHRPRNQCDPDKGE